MDRPTLIRHIVLTLVILLAAPSYAMAHLVNSGLGPFYDGAVHFFLSPEDGMGLLAAAFLAGLCGAKAGRRMLTVLPTTWLLGACLGFTVPAIPTWELLSVVSFVVLGLLVTLDPKLPSWSIAALGASLGIVHGALNGASLRESGGSWVNVLGIVCTVACLTLLVTAFVVSLRPAWARIVVRVAGSWIVAIGMLMIGWMFRGAL